MLDDLELHSNTQRKYAFTVQQYQEVISFVNID